MQDGRYAVYTKYHHSLMDGVSALRLVQRAFTPDPEDDEVRVPWNLGPRKRKEPRKRPSLVERVGRSAGSALALAPSTVKLARAALLEQQLTLPFRAPRSMFNVRIGGARRVAAQSWSLDRIKAVKSAAGVTVNDVVLAMSSGALRAYLLEHNALPDAPLTAMVPVNLRKDDDDRGGNLVGTFLCNLATDLDDPAKRLEVISSSIRDTKEVFAQLPPVQQLALSAFNIGGLFFGLIPGYLSTALPAVQHRHFERLGRPLGAAVLAWCPFGRKLSAVDPARRAGGQHHRDQQRRQPRLRSRRLPPQRAAPAAAPGPFGDFAEGSGARLRRVRLPDDRSGLRQKLVFGVRCAGTRS